MSSPAKKFRVRDGRVLHFPQEWCDETTRVWIRSGQIVDLDDPELAKLAVGQLYKLEPVEEGEMTWTIDQAPAPLRRHLSTIARKLELEAEALLREARALLSAGDERGAKRVLKKLAGKKYADTPAAAEGAGLVDD